jgi:hypothetical protein
MTSLFCALSGATCHQRFGDHASVDHSTKLAEVTVYGDAANKDGAESSASKSGQLLETEISYHLK